jgi:hypothetical protein
MGYFKCVKNADGVVTLKHSVDSETGAQLGTIEFRDNERFAENQIKEGEVTMVSYSFSKVAPENVSPSTRFPED